MYSYKTLDAIKRVAKENNTYLNILSSNLTMSYSMNPINVKTKPKKGVKLNLDMLKTYIASLIQKTLMILLKQTTLLCY